MAAIYSNGGNRWNILGFNFTKRDALSSLYKISMVDINRREQGCATHYEQYCQHVVTALFNCNNLEQHG
jgi:hypothetical protein